MGEPQLLAGNALLEITLPIGDRVEVNYAMFKPAPSFLETSSSRARRGIGRAKTIAFRAVPRHRGGGSSLLAAAMSSGLPRFRQVAQIFGWQGFEPSLDLGVDPDARSTKHSPGRKAKLSLVSGKRDPVCGDASLAQVFHAYNCCSHRWPRLGYISRPSTWHTPSDLPSNFFCVHRPWGKENK